MGTSSFNSRRAMTKHKRRAGKAAQESTDEGWESRLPDPSRETPDRVAADRDQAERLNRHLQRLKPEQADALRLRFFGGLKFQEIAIAMQCSLSTAKNRVRFGLEQLGRQLTSEDAAQPAKPTTQEKSS